MTPYVETDAERRAYESLSALARMVDEDWSNYITSSGDSPVTTTLQLFKTDEPVLNGDVLMIDPLRPQFVRKAKFDLPWQMVVANEDQPEVGGPVLCDISHVFLFA